jgi:hypothetical protein
MASAYNLMLTLLVRKLDHRDWGSAAGAVRL